MMMKSKRESYNLRRACHTEGLLYFKNSQEQSLCGDGLRVLSRQ